MNYTLGLSSARPVDWPSNGLGFDPPSPSRSSDGLPSEPVTLRRRWRTTERDELGNPVLGSNGEAAPFSTGDELADTAAPMRRLEANAPPRVRRTLCRAGDFD